MIINDEEKMLAYLKSNPGNINVIGEELLNNELSKRKNGEKSEILDLLEEQGKCRIYNNSAEYLMNSEYIILEHLKANPGRIGVIGEELLKRELLKRKKGIESKILDLLEKQKKCKIFYDSLEYLRNNEYIVLEYLKANPGNIYVIGEKLLTTELDKREKGEKSKILDLLEEQKKCNIFFDSIDYLRNNEYIVLEHLKANPGDIGVIGEELLNNELAKRKNGEKSEILDLLEEKGKCRIYAKSPDFIRNNEYIVLKHLQANPGKIGVIGEKLLKREFLKRKKGKESKILELLEKQKKCTIYTDSHDYLKNNEYIILENLKANIGRIGVIGDKLLESELLKRKKGKKSKILDLLEKQKKCYIYATSSDYIKNNEYIVLKYLEFNNISDIKVDLIGKELLQKELNKGFEEDGKPKSEILNRIISIFEKNIKLRSNMPEILKNNTEFMKYLVEKIDISYLLYVDEKVFNDLWQYEEIRKKAEEKLELNMYGSDFIRNNKTIIDISLKHNWKTLNYVGEQEFENYIKQYTEKFYLLPNSLPHIKKNQNAIEYTIQNKTAQFNYIDHDILISEFKKVLNFEESELFEQLAQSLEIKDKDAFYKVLKELFEKNNSVLFNLNINLLKESFSIIRPYLSLICNDMKIQNAICGIHDRSKDYLKVLGKILGFISKNYQGMNNQDLITDIIYGMESSEYKELLKDLNGKDIDEQNTEKLAWLFCNANYFSIKTLEDVENLDSIINTVCDSIMEKPDGDFSKYPKINELSKPDRMMHAVMQRSGYMMGIYEAKKMVEIYAPLFEGIDINNLTDEENAIYEEIKNIEYVINLIENEEFEKLTQFLSNVYQDIQKRNDEFKTYKSRSYQTSILNNLVTRLYNEKCYDTSNNKETEKITYEGSDLDVFYAGTDFSMLIHAVGAYNSQNRNIQDYKENWNVPETEYHSFSCSYIGDRMLGTARIENVVYGFNNIEPGGVIASAPWDIASNTYHNGYIPVKSVGTLNRLFKGNRVKFCNPDNQLDNTRHTHNEVLVERYLVRADGKLEKRQPNYIVYFCNTFDKEVAKQDKLWIESKKAAKQFGIPIVIVEREKCAEKESKEIQKMIKDGKQKSDIKIALDALNRLQTNIAGNRDYHIDIAMKYFPSSKTEEILELIKSILLQEIQDGNYEKFKEDFMQATEFEKKEKRKWEITGIVLTTEFEGYDHEKYLRELSDIYSMYLNAIKENKKNANELDVLRILNSNDESLKSIKYSEKILECIQTNTQLTCDEVVQIITKYNIEHQINEIKNTGIYDESRAHSIHHIQDVIIFGTVLGHKLGLDEKDMKILIEACKYHDSGRSDDYNTEHANASQEIAKERLEGLYSDEDLAIIRVAILFHEYSEVTPRKTTYFFKKLCKTYGVQDIKRARRIADILKDADAIDRCRFVNKAELNPSLLRLEQSRGLVEVSKIINEGYAKELCEQYGYLKNEIILKMIKKFGYLETERRIRKLQVGLKPAREKGEPIIKPIGRRIVARDDNNELLEENLDTDSEKTDTTKTGLFELYSDMGTTYYDTWSAEEDLHLVQEENDLNKDFSKEDN